MKKFLPLILLGVGVVFLVVAFLVVRFLQKPAEVVDEDENVPEIPFELRPYTSLTPTEDGHYLKLAIVDIKVEAASMDYEILYKVTDGRTQGVPGSVKLTGADVDKDILLGSESSGKFRYDEGVSEGTLTLRFRNDKGKLIGKLTTDFHLQPAVGPDSIGVENLTSLDGKFSYMLDSVPKTGFFVTMSTFGVPDKFEGSLSEGPYGVFSSFEKAMPGEVSLDGNVYQWVDGEWEMLEGGEASDLGVFVSASE